MNDKTIKMVEIWRPVEKGKGQAMVHDGLGGYKDMGLVAIIVDGYPIHIEDGYIIESRPITKEEAKRIEERVSQGK